MTLTDLAPLEKWVELQNELHEKFHINADIMDPQGHRMAGNAWGNDLCKLIRNHPKGLATICAPSGQAFTNLMQVSKAPFVEECDAGMVRISVPVVRDGELLGAVGGCGLLPDDGELEEFYIQMATEADDDRLAKLAATVRVSSRDKLALIVDYIKKRIAEIIGA